jgi:hypothetical protein
MSALNKLHARSSEGYVGVWAAPTHPHIPILLPRLTFFSVFFNIIQEKNKEITCSE